MKSFTSAILAAAVSANYCYSDGCNCNGETRACYSLPRQNMRPAVNTCCPVGVQPTVYGRDNGRSVNIPQTADEEVTSSLRRCEEIWLSATVTGRKTAEQIYRTGGEGTCFTVKGTGTTLTLAPASPDMTFKVYLYGNQTNVKLGNGVTGVNFDRLELKGDMNHAQLSSESTINVVKMKGSDNKITGNPTYCSKWLDGYPRTFKATQSPEVCAQYSGKSNLAISWQTKNTNGVINEDEIDVNTKNTSVNVQSNLLASCAQTFQARECAQVFTARGCNKLGLGNARKECEKNAGDVRKECEKAAGDVRKECEKAQTSNLQVYGGGQPNTHLAKLDNFKDCRDYNLYCCQEWNRFEWECLSQGLPSSNQNCKDVVSTAAAAGITADRPGTCNAQTSKLCIGSCYIW